MKPSYLTSSLLHFTFFLTPVVRAAPTAESPSPPSGDQLTLEELGRFDGTITLADIGIPGAPHPQPVELLTSPNAFLYLEDESPSDVPRSGRKATRLWVTQDSKGEYGVVLQPRAPVGEPVQFIPAEQLKRPIQFADGQVILSGWSDGSPSVKDIKSFEEFSKSLYDMAIDYNQALLRYLIDQGITLSAYQQRSTKPSDQENKFSESGDKHSLQSLDVIGSETTALADVILPKAGEALSTPGQTSTGGIEGKPAEPSSQLIGRDSPGAL